MSAQVDLQSNANIAYASNSTLAAGSAFWVHFGISGGSLNAVTGLSGVQRSMLLALTNAGLTSAKFILDMSFGLGTPVMQLIDSAASEWTVTHISGLDFGGFTAGSIYEGLLVLNDAATVGNSILVNIYAPGDLYGSIVATWASNPTLDVSHNVGCVQLGSPDLSGITSSFVGTEKIYDQCRIGVGANASGVSDFVSTLEEGSGSSVSPSGTISGTFSWIGGGPLPPMKFFRRQTFPRRR